MCFISKHMTAMLQSTWNEVQFWFSHLVPKIVCRILFLISQASCVSFYLLLSCWGESWMNLFLFFCLLQEILPITACYSGILCCRLCFGEWCFELVQMVIPNVTAEVPHNFLGYRCLFDLTKKLQFNLSSYFFYQLHNKQLNPLWTKQAFFSVKM